MHGEGGEEDGARIPAHNAELLSTFDIHGLGEECTAPLTLAKNKPWHSASIRRTRSAEDHTDNDGLEQSALHPPAKVEL